MIKSGAKFVGKSALLILAGSIVGTLLLVLAYMLPVNIANRDSSYGTLEEEGWYPRASVSSRSLDAYFYSFFPDVLDNGTDKIMLYMAMDDSEGSPLYRALDSYNAYIGSYAYYWHGYVAVLRPLFLLFDFAELRIVNGICQILLILVLALMIGRKKGIRYVLMLAASYVLLMPFALAMGLQFTWIFYISFIGALVLIKKRDFFEEKKRYLFCFIALGMFTCYFDLLTYPLVTWGIPLIWWITMDNAERKEVDWVKRVVTTGFSWIAGYALMWIMKWVYATPILGRNVLEAGINEVFVRSGTSAGNAYSLSARLETIYTNWKHYEYKVFAMLLMLWLLWWIVQMIFQGGIKRDSRRYAYLLVGVSSVVWYFVLADHTQIHHFFTYRIFAVSVLAFLALVLCSTSPASKAEMVSIKKRLVVCGVLLMAAVLSIPLALLAREKILVINGEGQFMQMSMDSGDYFEVEFSPAFDEIRGIDLGLQSDALQGYCIISLWDEDQLEYQETLFPGNFDGNFQDIGAHWKLHRGKTYRLVLDVADTDQPMYIWVTADGSMSLSEYGGLSVNGHTVAGQLLTAITYWALPTARKTQIFIAMTWMGVLLAIGYVLWPKERVYQR